MLAIVRPDGWNLPLLVHVAGAMLLVGALVVALAVTAGALRRGDDAAVLTRLAYRTLLIGVLPAYLTMRVGAEWIASEEAVGDDAAWIGIGYGTSDAGLLLTSSRRCSPGAPHAAAPPARAARAVRSSCCRRC